MESYMEKNFLAGKLNVLPNHTSQKIKNQKSKDGEL
jgi:hypothetical protein